MTESYDLVIVGLGPVGAVAANLAGQQGLRTLVLERETAILPIPRAIGFDHEAMRIFSNIGVADAITPYVAPYWASEYRTTGGDLIRRIRVAEPPYLSGWAPNYVFRQPQVEAVLRQNLRSFTDVQVEFDCRVTDVATGEGATSVTYVDAGGSTRTVRTGFVAACDGASSTVREQHGLPLEDLDFDEPWLVVDVFLRDGAGAALPVTNVQYCETRRPCTFVVGVGRHRRWEFAVNEGQDPAAMLEPGRIRELLSRWLAPEDYELVRASTYRFHALVLETWRSGSTFFLGDAAHMTPPFLAQGMCQGIRDAANLVWKLVAVRRGYASSRLLDTYQQERRPHVLHTTRVTKELGRVICERDPGRAARRDADLRSELAANPEGTIRQSLIPALSTGLLASDHFTGQGEIMPQGRVVGVLAKEGLLDEFTGALTRLVVRDDVALPDSARGAAREALRGIDGCLIELTRQEPRAQTQYRELDGVLSGWMHAHGCEILLARPDHYVFGAAASAADTRRLLGEFTGGLAGLSSDPDPRPR